MNRQDYLSKLNSLLELGDNFTVLVHFAIKCNGGHVVKRANVKNEVLETLSAQYKFAIEDEVSRLEADEELEILDLSSRDERANVIYRYDLPDEEPSFFTSMREVMTIQPADYFTGNKLFDFNIDNLSDIDYFIISIGSENNKIVVYRNNYNINLLKQARGRLYINKSGTQFDVIAEDILRLDTQMDAIQINNDVFILNLSFLDTNKEFSSIIVRRAENSINIIENMELVENIDGLRDRLSELSFARRLMRALDSSPVTEMPKQTIFDFIGNHEKLRSLLKIVDDKIVLSTKKSQDCFIRLLNDDFLHSNLTDKDYESKAKGHL